MHSTNDQTANLHNTARPLSRNTSKRSDLVNVLRVDELSTYYPEPAFGNCGPG